MKTKHFFIFLFSIWFCYLFFEQQFGLNLFAFTLSLIVYYIIFERKSYSSILVITTSIGAAVSSFFAFYLATPLPIIATFISIAILNALIFAPKLSIINALMQGTGKLFLSLPYFVFQLLERKTQNTIKSNYLKKMLLIIFALIIVGIFFVLYQNANPDFYELSQKINFKWIKFSLLRFYLVSSFIILALCSPILIKSLVEKDAEWLSKPLNQQKDVYKNSWFAMLMGFKSEVFLATILFALLNALIAVVNVVDITKLWLNPILPHNIDSYSSYVHNGVSTLIVSIVFAISIILFFFRGYTSFSKEFKIIKLLSFIWIAQNAFLLFSTALRNYLYVEQYGLSHKRIGVFIYLAFALIGLILTFYKILAHKNTYFLFNSNALAFYLCMLFLMPINWDSFITKHNMNLSEKNKTTLDVEYLSRLSYANLNDLLAYKEKNKQNLSDYQAALIDQKWKNFKESSEDKQWQSYSILKSNLLKTYNHENTK